MIALLLLACTATPDDTNPGDTDTGEGPALTDDERAAMDTWTDTEVSVTFGETTVQADRLVFFLPLDAGADLPDLDGLARKVVDRAVLSVRSP